MPRTMSLELEAFYRAAPETHHATHDLLVEVDQERAVSKALAEALLDTRNACAAMMRGMVKVCEPDMTDFITSQASEYDGFGKRADAALALYRESEP